MTKQILFLPALLVCGLATVPSKVSADDVGSFFKEGEEGEAGLNVVAKGTGETEMVTATLDVSALLEKDIMGFSEVGSATLGV